MHYQSRQDMLVLFQVTYKHWDSPFIFHYFLKKIQELLSKIILTKDKFKKKKDYIKQDVRKRTFKKREEEVERI